MANFCFIVAQALVPAVSRLVSTRGAGVARRRTKSVPLSGDSPGMSAGATSYHPYPSFFFRRVRRGGAGDYVFAGGPVAQVDNAAAFAAKGEIGVARSDRFLTNGASHHTATRGEILMNAVAARGGAGS